MVDIRWSLNVICVITLNISFSKEQDKAYVLRKKK